MHERPQGSIQRRAAIPMVLARILLPAGDGTFKQAAVRALGPLPVRGFIPQGAA